MGLKEISRAIKRFVNGKRALIEISVGPPLPQVLQLDRQTLAYPLGPIGNGANIDFGIRLINSLGVPSDLGFLKEAEQQGAPFNDLMALVIVGLENDEFDKAARGQSKRIDRCRSLLGLYVAGQQMPILRIQWNEPKLASAEFLAPIYRGVRNRVSDDPISPEFLSSCTSEHYTDDQLHYFIGILEQIHGIKEFSFKIARYYSLLEVMSSPIKSQFEKQSGGSSITRTAIRFMLGYFQEFDIPRFTINPENDFEFDHIELAGRIRDKIFHGGGEIKHSDVPIELRSGVDLLNQRPDMITHWLRRDCESEIFRWAQRSSRAWLAQSGTNYILPKRNPNYDGRVLIKPLISSSNSQLSAVGSAYARVSGSEIGILRLHISE